MQMSSRGVKPRWQVTMSAVLWGGAPRDKLKHVCRKREPTGAEAFELLASNVKFQASEAA